MIVSVERLGDVDFIITGTLFDRFPGGVPLGNCRATLTTESRFISMEKVLPVRNPPDQPSGRVPSVSSISSGTFPELCKKILASPSLPKDIENPSSARMSRVVISFTSRTVALVTILSSKVVLTVTVFLSPFTEARGTIVLIIILDSELGSISVCIVVTSPNGGSSSYR